MFVVAVGTAALVIVLSVFNGMEDLIRSLHGYFDPELKIEAYAGKSFPVSDQFIDSIRHVPGVAIVTEVIEDNAYLRYKNAEMVVKVKGVQDNFVDHHRLDERIRLGEMKLRENGVPYAVIGQGVGYTLNIVKLNDLYTLQFYYPRRKRVSGFNPTQLTNQKSILIGGIFAIEKQYDASYAFVPLDFAADLMEYENRRTSLEIKVADGFSANSVQKELKDLLGARFEVLNRDEQHSSLLKAIKVEKLFVYIAFTFILAVSSFNIFFSLTMLAIDKKKDIAVLYAMGATRSIIKKIFLAEGAIISLSGAIVGLLAGLLICVVQQQFGLVSMGMNTAVLDAYPVKIQFPDFFYTAVSIILITLAASYRPASIATKVEVRDTI
jgi:lipoprotein-releasing system permease protein